MTDRTTTPAVVELGEEFLREPYAVLARLRSESPVCKVTLHDGLQAWMVTRYEAVRAALTDERLKLDMRDADALFDAHRPGGGTELGSYGPERGAHLLNTDPPDHTRLRKLVTREFTAKRVEALRPRIEQIADELLDDMARHDEVDLIEAFAFVLPIIVICELLGVPPADRMRVREWTDVFVNENSVRDSDAASFALAGYSFGLIRDKRAEPGDDLLSALVHARDTDDGRLSEHELISMIFVLIIAGHETTVNLIGNGVLALFREPEQLSALIADPSLVPGAVEEFLRLRPPLNTATIRRTEEPIEIDGVTIPAQELVLLGLAAANRDGEFFDDPDRLHVTEPAGRHMAFGHGIHHCVGAALARVEGQVAFEKLLERFPGLRPAVDEDELAWKRSTLVRGPTRLPVRLR